MTVPVLIIFKHYFLLIFDHFFVGHVIVKFKSLFGVVVWKCQIAKIYLSLKSTEQWQYCFFYFFQLSDHLSTIPWFATFCQICVSFYWTCPRRLWCWKSSNQLVGNFDVYLRGKNQLHLWLLFWDIVETLQFC